MAISREELQQERDDLQRAINSGALTVSHNGKTVTYRDLTSMRRVLNQIDLQLAGGRRKFVHYLTMGSGDVPGGTNGNGVTGGGGGGGWG